MATPKEHSIGLVQFLAISAIAVVIFIAWDFGHRVLETMDLLQSDAQAEVRLQAAQDVNAQLKDLKSRVTTDEYVEQYARNRLHWTRPDETLFVSIAMPVPPKASAPLPAAEPPPARPVWREWLDLLINAVFGPAS